MSESKIQLSADEMSLVQNSHWILTKHRVIEKVYAMFGGLSDAMRDVVSSTLGLPEEMLASSPKISKGEQYERMPYVVLDYPRVFSKDDVLAVRTFFWWGHYFSCTLHLKGKFHELYHQKLSAMLQHEEWSDYSLSVEGNEFNFDVEHEDYSLIKKGGIQPTLYNTPFIKISYKSSFAYWDTTADRLLEAFRRYVTMLAR